MNSFLDTSLGFVTNRVANRLRAELALRFSQSGYDITPDQWSVLSRLMEEDGLPQNILGDRIAKDKTNIARMIALMEKKGLVRRVTDGEDKRQRNIYLTDYGREIVPALQSIAKGILQDAQQTLSQGDIERVIAVLNRVYDNLS